MLGGSTKLLLQRGAVVSLVTHLKTDSAEQMGSRQDGTSFHKLGISRVSSIPPNVYRWSENGSIWVWRCRSLASANRCPRWERCCHETRVDCSPVWTASTGSTLTVGSDQGYSSFLVNWRTLSREFPAVCVQRLSTELNSSIRVTVQFRENAIFLCINRERFIRNRFL